MIKNDFIPEGGFGIVLARAGVGKTALMTRLALDIISKNENVLHISLNDSINKIDSLYKEVFHHLIKQDDNNKQTWDSVLPHRFIMAFKADDFSLLKIEETLINFKAQNIFFPKTIIIDGLVFDETSRENLENLKNFINKQSMRIWFASLAQRHNESFPNNIPEPFSKLSDLFDVVVQLQPQENSIKVKILKGKDSIYNQPAVFFDPSNMQIENTG